eukprot:gene1979-2301_t
MSTIHFHTSKFTAFVAALQQQAETPCSSTSATNQLCRELLHPSSLGLLTAAASQLNATANPAIHWMPEFGCAVMPVRGPLADMSRICRLKQAAPNWTATAAAAPPVLRPDDVALYLVFPDRWEFDIHR